MAHVFKIFCIYFKIIYLCDFQKLPLFPISQSLLCLWRVLHLSSEDILFFKSFRKGIYLQIFEIYSLLVSLLVMFPTQLWIWGIIFRFTIVLKTSKFQDQKVSHKVDLWVVFCSRIHKNMWSVSKSRSSSSYALAFIQNKKRHHFFFFSINCEAFSSEFPDTSVSKVMNYFHQLQILVWTA